MDKIKSKIEAAHDYIIELMGLTNTAKEENDKKLLDYLNSQLTDLIHWVNQTETEDSSDKDDPYGEGYNPISGEENDE